MSTPPSTDAAATGVLTPAGFPWAGANGAGSETVVRPAGRPGSQAEIAVLETPASSDTSLRLFPMGADGLARAQADPQDIAGVTLGDYTLLRRLGMGGMGAVFLAVDNHLRRQVALKVLSPGQARDASAVARFRNEARAGAALDHEHVARVFHYGEDQGLHFIAFEYITGVNLRDLIRQRGRLDPGEAVGYTLQVAGVLAHLESAGVVHRDIKPSNILISQQGVAKLVDLGLARIELTEESAELTVAGTTLGTFDYISPEQAKDPRSVDIRSDIYSLGCTLYHMLTGEPPYPEGTVLQKLLDHQGKESPDPALKNRRVSSTLSAVVRRMMASDPRKRFATPQELIAELTQIGRGMGLQIVPRTADWVLRAPNVWQQMWDRNSAWVAMAGALILFVMLLDRYPRLVEWSRSPGATLTPIAARTGTPPVVSAPDRLVPEVPDEDVPPIKDRTKPRAGEPKIVVAETTAVRPPAVTTGTPDFPTSKSPLFTPFEDQRLSSLIPSTVSQWLDLSKNGDVPAGPSARGPFFDEPLPATPSKTATGPAVAAVETTPVAPPPATATTADTAPFAIIGGKSFDTLEAACSAAKTGDVIELRYDGRRREKERTIRVVNKHLTIRAGRRFRPVVEFQPADALQTRMLTVAGGSLSLVNLELELIVPENLNSDLWALFSLERPEKLLLQSCTATIVNRRHVPAAFVEQVVPAGQSLGAMTAMKMGQPPAPVEVQINKSIVRGGGDLAVVHDPGSAVYRIEESLVAVEDSVFHVLGLVDMLPEQHRLDVTLQHVTLAARGSLVRMQSSDDFADRLLPVSISSRNNLFNIPGDRSLVEIQGPVDTSNLRQFVNWSGERNFYNAIDLFWQVSSSPLLAPSTTIRYDNWRTMWGTSELSGSKNQVVQYRNAWEDRDYSRVVASDFELDDASESNPALEAATDGSNAGAPLLELPTPSASLPASVTGIK